MLKRSFIFHQIEKMNNTFRDSLYLFFILFIILSSCKSDNLVEKSGQWDQIKHGEYLVENNTWNVQVTKSKWTETIFCDTLKGKMGWKWDFSSERDTPNSFLVKSFPEIIFGKKPYDNYKSTSSRLPIELTSNQFHLEYEYIVNANGVYNTTTDISFTDNKNPNSNNIRAKMMIWFDHQNFPFFESEKLKQALIGGIKYEVFVDTAHIGPEGKWVFIALLPDNFPSKGKLNLKDYFDYFLSDGVLKSEWYLSSIEIGSEISSGKGEITFKKFLVH
jgi:thioredoxin-related protein